MYLERAAREKLKRGERSSVAAEKELGGLGPLFKRLDINEYRGDAGRTSSGAHLKPDTGSENVFRIV